MSSFHNFAFDAFGTFVCTDDLKFGEKRFKFRI